MPLSANSDKDAVKIAGKELIDRIESVMDNVDWASFFKLADMIPSGKRIFVTGAGRSGLVAACSACVSCTPDSPRTSRVKPSRPPREWAT